MGKCVCRNEKVSAEVRNMSMKIISSSETSQKPSWRMALTDHHTFALQVCNTLLFMNIFKSNYECTGRHICTCIIRICTVGKDIPAVTNCMCGKFGKL